MADVLGERGLAAPGDIAEDGVPEELVRLTLARLGRVDILVNNAAMARSTRFGDLKAEEWRETMEVNLTAPFLMTKAVLSLRTSTQRATFSTDWLRDIPSCASERREKSRT